MDKRAQIVLAALALALLGLGVLYAVNAFAPSPAATSTATGTQATTTPGTAATPGTYTGSPEGTYTARMGETLSAAGFRVTVLELIEDSRCPADVQCVWAGTVKVRVRAEYGQLQAVETLELGSPISALGYQAELVGVEPAKTQSAIPDSSYVFRFKVTRN